MARIAYTDMAFRKSSLETIGVVNGICAEYSAQGYSLTLRQLYYQFVARGYIANNDREYKQLGALVNNGRLAGLIDWNYLEDRTRNMQQNSHWDNPGSILSSAAYSYRLDRWQNQPNYCEVWVEKEALAAVVERTARRMDVPYFSCRGYVSQSEMHSAAQRMVRMARGASGRRCIHIIHLGDHDPSGIDMTRDIQDRMDLFCGWYGVSVVVNRIALTMAQVEEFNPPPNPAKLTDARAQGYIEQYGDESWELDALDPRTMDRLITEAITELLDEDLYKQKVAQEQVDKSTLTAISDNWGETYRWLDEQGYIPEAPEGETDTESDSEYDGE